MQSTLNHSVCIMDQLTSYGCNVQEPALHASMRVQRRILWFGDTWLFPDGTLSSLRMALSQAEGTRGQGLRKKKHIYRRVYIE